MNENDEDGGRAFHSNIATTMRVRHVAPAGAP